MAPLDDHEIPHGSIPLLNHPPKVIHWDPVRIASINMMQHEQFRTISKRSRHSMTSKWNLERGKIHFGSSWIK